MAVTAGVVDMARPFGYVIGNYGGAHRGLIVESNSLVLDDGNGNPQLGHGENVPLTLETGGIFDLNGNNETVDALVMNGGILQNENTNSSLSTLTITYSGGVATLQGGTNQFNVGQTASLTINAAITGSGTFVMNGPGVLTLMTNNTYTGQTTIQGGTLALPDGATIFDSTNIYLATPNAALDWSQNTNVSSSGNPLLTLQNGQTLSGFGVVTGLVATVTGATLAPGSTTTVGTLTVTGSANDSNVLSGIAMMKLNKGGHTNDQLVIQQGSLVLGGTLALNNLSGTLAAGDSFTLFVVPGGISGAFASITPASPGYALGWSTTNLAVNGTLSIIAVTPPPTPAFSSVRLSGTTLIMQATNGEASGQYVLLESTNLALPLADWVPVLTNNFDGSGNFSNSISTTNARSEFFQIAP
jgi:autotransporter-associated beta strand protein